VEQMLPLDNALLNQNLWTGKLLPKR